MSKKFNVLDENGIERQAEVITSFDYKDKTYLIYSIDVDGDNAGVFVSKLLKDNEGFDLIEDIDDENEKNEIGNIVNELLDSVE